MKEEIEKQIQKHEESMKREVLGIFRSYSVKIHELLKKIEEGEKEK